MRLASVSGVQPGKVLGAFQVNKRLNKKDQIEQIRLDSDCFPLSFILSVSLFCAVYLLQKFKTVCLIVSHSKKELLKGT